MVGKVFALIWLRCDIFEIGVTIFVTQNVQPGISKINFLVHVVSDVDPDPHYGWPDLDSGAKF